jgi:tetratricopeptide (TPR) repeat protein
MKKIAMAAFWLFVAATVRAQDLQSNGNYTLAIPTHKGQLNWNAGGFETAQVSAKPNGAEIGVRAKDASNQFSLLGFLFLFPEQAPMTSAKCRDGVMEPVKKSNPTIQIAASSQMARPDGPPLELVAYVRQGPNEKLVYSVRGFLAIDDLCGDLEIYGDDVSVISDPNLKKIWDSYHLDPQYVPEFNDVFQYAQILYGTNRFQAAAPIFEQALAKIKNDDEQLKWRRITTDQAGIAYGLAGNIPKARTLFNEALAKDPDYPMYYYNLACADAQENKLADARAHLQQAFARKGNMLKGETMPEPATDDSFLPYRDNKEFWAFVESLH